MFGQRIWNQRPKLPRAVMAHRSRTEGAAGDGAKLSFKGKNVYLNRQGNF